VWFSTFLIPTCLYFSSKFEVCFCRFGGKSICRATPRGAKRYFAHTHTSDLPLLTLSPNDTTPQLPTQPHPTSLYPHPPLAPSTTHHCTPTSHPLPPHMTEIFVKLCFQKFPLKATSRPHASLKCRV